jgi:hypothetical protein
MQKSIDFKEKETAPVVTGNMFDIMYVSNENESVAVVESAIIDFSQVIEQLRMGNSIFIAPKTQCVPANQKKPKKRRNNGYINHV